MKLRSLSHLSNKARSKKSEKAAAKFAGGKLQPASGALKPKHLKGDIKSDRFVIDDKVTNQKGFNVKSEFWRKLSSEAFASDRRPMIRISFTDGPNLYVIDELTLEELLDEIRDGTQDRSEPVRTSSKSQGRNQPYKNRRDK